MRKKTYNRMVGIMFSEESYEKLVSITDQLEITVSEFIREVVEKQLRKNQQGGSSK